MKAKCIFKTSRLAVLEVCDAKADYVTAAYQVSVNGETLFSTDHTIVTVYDLAPDTDYNFEFARNEETCVVAVKTDAEFVTLDVTAFGAKGDGETDDTASLQAAILCAPKDSRVYVPAGTYRFTHLFLKSDLVLELAENAVLKAIPDKTKLPVLPGRIESTDGKGEYLPGTYEGEPQSSYASLLTAFNCEHVVVCGRGTIDGAADFDNWWSMEQIKGDPIRRPKMFFTSHCEDVVLQGVTICNSPCWNMHPYFTNHVRFLDLHIQSHPESHNTDGIDPESCADVEIAGIHFSVGDDCIAIKSGKIYMGKTYKTPSRNVVVRNCLMERGHGGVTIGSEIGAGVDNILVKNCHFVETDRGLRVKTRRGRGEDSVLSGITFSNVLMDGVGTDFVINAFYFCDKDGKTDYVQNKGPLPVDERTPKVGKITISDVTCRNTQVAGIFFYGLPESKIECVNMENVSISFDENAKPGMPAMMCGIDDMAKKGIFIRNAKTVRLENVQVSGNEGEALDMEEVDSISWEK